MTVTELAAVMRGIAPGLREYVAKALDARTKADEPTIARLVADRVDEAVEKAVEKAVSALPPAKDGRDGKDAIVPDVAALVEKAVAALPVPTNGRDGKDGVDGVSVDPAVVEALIATHVAKAVSALPVPRDGKDGRDIDPAALEVVVSAHVEKAIRAIPLPKDGQDGAPGSDGRSVTIEEVVPFIAKEIEQRVAALPVAKDRIGFTGAVIDRDGHLVVTRSDGTTHDVGVVIGADGKDGLDGKDAIGTPGQDGLGFDDMESAAFDAARKAVIFTYRRGEQSKELVVPIPGVLTYREVFKAGVKYEAGDAVTWAGSLWIATEATSAKPGEMSLESRAWRLAVKKGSDGKAGQPGRDGKDLREK